MFTARLAQCEGRCRLCRNAASMSIASGRRIRCRFPVRAGAFLSFRNGWKVWAVALRDGSAQDVSWIRRGSRLWIRGERQMRCVEKNLPAVEACEESYLPDYATSCGEER